MTEHNPPYRRRAGPGRPQLAAHPGRGAARSPCRSRLPAGSCRQRLPADPGPPVCRLCPAAATRCATCWWGRGRIRAPTVRHRRVFHGRRGRRAVERTGLSKPVNRATSLRNFMKMLLVADGQSAAGCDRRRGDGAGGGAAARAPIATLAELQANLLDAGFSAAQCLAGVPQPRVAPAVEPKPGCRSCDVCWRRWRARSAAGVVGEDRRAAQKLPEAAALGQIVAEHPYNLSFIKHGGMHARLAQCAAPRARVKNGALKDKPNGI